ncbi:hypothetical protein FHR71_001169 [Methylobacterium sp. RAS18]|nr:hypothetical protein [Methylobacterium sp. RAS18]
MPRLVATLLAVAGAWAPPPPSSPPKLPPFLFVLPPEPRIEDRKRPTYRPLH